jgi:hypothetical protein
MPLSTTHPTFSGISFSLNTSDLPIRCGCAMAQRDRRRVKLSQLHPISAETAQLDSAGKGYIRADGRNMHNMYLFEVKAPAGSKAPYDYYDLVRSIPEEEAFRPMEQGECPLVRKE